MTDINFYVSEQIGLSNRLDITYRLVIQALKHNLKIYIHTDNQKTSQKVDDLLWTKERASFISHAVVDLENKQESQSQLAFQNQINISHEFEPHHHCDYLINLSNQRPAFFSRFLKVAEILDKDDVIITAGRERYSFYRDRGYTLGYHQL